MNNLLESTHELFEQSLKDLNYDRQKLEEKIFESCRFEGCHFVETDFQRCQFIDCEFINCNLSNAKIKNCLFSEIVFDGCKLIGMNWTEVKWPLVKLTSPVKFYKSNLDDCSFFELDLSELTMEFCLAKRVDFRGSNLSHGSFVETDFEGALFLGTNIELCNFSDAVNYVIDPMQNKIKKAKFSMPEAMNLLLAFEIEVEGVSA
jgi:fluoroquinolone resistance protein